MRKKSRFGNIMLVFTFIAGLSLLLYPSVANYVNEKVATKAISAYAAGIAQIEDDEYEEMLESARAYNANILKRQDYYILSDEEKERYESLLDPAGNGVMGYIEIPTINVSLPVYHGTSDLVLQSAVGHLEWSSLPIGGESTHSVLSGHRGLPSAKLFTNLDMLVEGDEFSLRILDEIMSYEVDQILIVDPLDTEALQIYRGKDYCTLVTCTPYGINTHRLLVRGHRVERTDYAAMLRITSEAMQIEPQVIASILGIPTLILLMIVFLAGSGKSKSPGRRGR